MRAFRLTAILTACLAQAAVGALAAPPAAGTPANIVLENDCLRHILSPQGRTLHFQDKRTGKDYCADPGQRPFAAITRAGQRQALTACAYQAGRLTMQFGKTGVTVVAKVVVRKRHFAMEVVSVSDAGVEEIELAKFRVTCAQAVSGMSGIAADGEFAAVLRGCNLQVRTQVAGRPTVLAGRCFRRYGLVGAKLAWAGCPAGDVRDVLKEIVRDEGLPQSPLGGPFALDAPANRGSYVFAGVSESTVDDWIALARKAGLAQIHFHPWWQSLGHYEPHRGLFPHGPAGLKAAVDKVHAAGLMAGMHTLTGCIDPRDPWVTPRPDPRLAFDAAYALAADLDAKALTVPTREQPGEFDTVWAYGGHGNVIRIDDELIHFTGLSRKAPYAFTACRRGAFGTKVAPHRAGAAVRHLFVRYGCFQPAEDSTLVDELAGRIADVFNTCGFDMIYMDGAEGMIGGWHGVAKLRWAIFRKLKRRVLVEASEWGNESWVFHSRLGAWDYPNWGLKAFIDSHCRATLDYRRRHLLPAQLGWWAIFGPTREHDAELPDELEYLCVKSLALDAPMSFQALRPGPNPPNGRQEEYLDMLGRYERLRRGGAVPPAVRKQLAEAGAEFRLNIGKDGRWAFVPVEYLAHKVTGLKDGRDAWTFVNRHAAQPAQLRIQALYAVEPFESPRQVVLADFGKESEFPVRGAAKGVTVSLRAGAAGPKAGHKAGELSARSAAAGRRGAWALAGKRFPGEIDLGPCDAIGLWVHGDGGGQLLNVQLATPRQYYRALSEHYVRIDFAGWRYVELLFRERDAGPWADHVWPYPGHYNVYRGPLVRGHVSELNLYLNDLPPGKTATCRLGEIRALPVRKVELRNPAVTIGGRRITFPVAVESGGYVEYASMTHCRLYDAHAKLVKRFRPEGAPPMAAVGKNDVRFTCQGPEGLSARAKVTVILHGMPLTATPAGAPPGATR